MLAVNTLPGQRSALPGFVVAGRNYLAWYGSVIAATRRYKGGSSKAVGVSEGLRTYISTPAGITCVGTYWRSVRTGSSFVVIHRKQTADVTVQAEEASSAFPSRPAE